jgi:hypothetical protein
MKSIKSLESKRSTFTSSLSTLMLSLVPVLKSCPPCPLCMPKYAALLSFLGLPLADYSHYLTPFMVLSMLFTCGSMLWQAHRYTQEWRPAFLAIFSCSSLLLARHLDLAFLSYSAMASLLFAVVLHQWKMKAPHQHSCCDSHACK